MIARRPTLNGRALCSAQTERREQALRRVRNTRVRNGRKPRHSKPWQGARTGVWPVCPWRQPDPRQRFQAMTNWWSLRRR
jgi:hypothetical protein